LEFFYSTEKDIIKCNSVVLGKIIERNIERALISSPEILERVQRRDYFRLPIQLKTKYCLLPRQNTYRDLRDIPLQCFRNFTNTFTIDISGGGIKIVSKESMNKGDKVLVSTLAPN
jgi:c-di-GMP-binding flagellar brake protein YcgR